MQQPGPTTADVDKARPALHALSGAKVGREDAVVALSPAFPAPVPHSSLTSAVAEGPPAPATPHTLCAEKISKLVRRNSVD